LVAQEVVRPCRIPSADAWCDTTTPHGELMVTILAGLATFERHLIAARTGEGRKRAMAAGVRFGRPKVLSAFQEAEAYKRKKAGEPLSLIAQAYRVSVSTIARLQP
jgi:DNA invertase Pin-like site-specific DNA recombinase